MERPVVSNSLPRSVLDVDAEDQRFLPVKIELKSVDDCMLARNCIRTVPGAGSSSAKAKTEQDTGPEFSEDGFYGPFPF